MIVTLIKAKQMFSITLPDKVKGRYWLQDTDANGDKRNLISIEAVGEEWILKSNKKAAILNANNEVVGNTVIKPQDFFNLKLSDSNERVILFAESIDESRYTFKKAMVKDKISLDIGRTEDNDFFYNNKFTSGKHAKLVYDGKSWLIIDCGSTNGTYVNGYRVNERKLFPGDMIYIMGLKIIIGSNFIAFNNPDGALKINSQDLYGCKQQEIDYSRECPEIPDKKYFYRSPRFYKEIERSLISIDPPPQVQKVDTVPLALMLGPSLTMGLTSLSTGLLTLNNVISNGGNITQALPTLIMSVSMLLGTVLWPILTKRHEKKEKRKNELKRQEKYLEYLESVRDDIKRKTKEQSDILNENIVTVEECVNRTTEEKTNLWERSLGQSDFLTLRLGVGNLPLNAEVKFPEKRFTMDEDNLQDAMLALGNAPKELLGVPISISLVDNTTVGIYGNEIDTTSVIESFVLQMSSLHSYDELKIVFVYDEEENTTWNFIRCLPHFWDNDKQIRFIATDSDEIKELSAYIEKNIISRGDISNREYTDCVPYYVIISTSKKLSEKIEPLQQLIKFKNNCCASAIFVSEELKDLPKETKTIIHVDGNNSRIFDREDTSGKSTSFALDSFDEFAIGEFSKSLANIELDLSTQRYSLPAMLTFLEMFDVGKIEHLNSLTRWKENNPTKTLQTPVGVDSYGGLFNLDLHEKYHGPHGLVAGMTGSGKSEFIITYILSLAVNYHPDEVAFILIDYKGGGLTGAFEDENKGIKLPHLAGTITNLDGAAITRSLISIQSELRRRQAIFNEARRISNEGTMDIYKYQQLYRDKIVKESVPHLFIISDEFAELKTQQPEFMEQLISAARIGRSLGVHLILATQKPSGVVDDQIWSNSKFRVCLKVQEKADSQDMIKCPDAAELSQTGRFYLQVGFNELFALGQSAWCGAEYLPTENVEKTVDNSIRFVDTLGRTTINLKPSQKKVSSESKTKQLVAIVKYLSDLAAEEEINIRPLWLPPIPSAIYIDELEEKYSKHDSGIVLNPIVGEYDDPFNQKQGLLTIPFSKDGNVLIYGATGNGKTTFLTAICYSLIKNHTADEVNIYIMDFGSETLKVFENAPQVGGVVVSADYERTVNLLKMLQEEIEKRKNLFSEYGGDYLSYCKNSGEVIPNIVVLLNNYAGFTEQFEDLIESFNLLSRDGVKYGIFFAVTASTTNAVRYVVQQNFKTMLTMQLNDATDYSIIVGKTNGLIPTKCKGRGLILLDKVYEFQTAYCCKGREYQEFIRNYCAELKNNSNSYAKPIPVLPESVDLEYVKSEIDGIGQIPIGVNKASLNIEALNMSKLVAYPVVAQDILETTLFVSELVKVLAETTKTCLVDSEKILNGEFLGVENIHMEDIESFVTKLFSEMVERNNTYKDSGLNIDSLEGYDRRVLVFVGYKKMYEQLSDDGKDKLNLIIEKAESIYKLHFIIVDNVNAINELSYTPWYRRHISGTDGIWIGDGVTDQYVIKLNKLSSELYEEIGYRFGYVVRKGRPSLTKLLSPHISGEDD